MSESGKTGEKSLKQRRKKSRRIRKTIVLILLLTLTGTAGVLAVRKLQRDYTVTYDAYTTTTGTISNSMNYSGSIQLINNTIYTAEETAKIREIYVSAGDHVKKGDKLIRLSNGTTLTAEFEGTVNTVAGEKGEEARKDSTLVQVTDFGKMQISFRIGESDISQVSAGQNIRVTVPSAGAVFDTTIKNIDYSTYSGNNVAYYTATAEIDTSSVQGIYPGMQATVTIPKEEVRDVVILKMDAVSTDADNSAFVYLRAEDGTMVKQPITPGVSNGNYVEIREGLSEGETVYAIARKEESDGGFFAGLFGTTQVNAPSGGFQGGGNRNGNGGNRPSGSGQNR